MTTRAKPVVSRADLVRLYDEALDHVSAFTGYHRKPEVKKSLVPLSALDLTSSATIKFTTSTPELALGHEAVMPFWRPVSFKIKTRPAHQGKAPQAYEMAIALETKDLQADPCQRPPAPQPLCPWSRIWPFLRSALGAVQDQGALDIPQIIRLSAQMRPMPRLPRMLRRGWARRCLLIIDMDTRLVPFWQDKRQLCDNLIKIRGAAGLDMRLFEHGPFGPVRNPVKNEPILASFKTPEPGTPILIHSDLGLFDRAAHATRNPKLATLREKSSPGRFCLRSANTGVPAAVDG